jgi:hypothetical protein
MSLTDDAAPGAAPVNTRKALTDTAVRNAKPGAKPVKLYDERGLFLLVTPTGGKWWRLKYRFDNKESCCRSALTPIPV